MSSPRPQIKTVAVLGFTGGLGLFVASALLYRVPRDFNSVVVVSRSDKLSPEAQQLVQKGAILKTVRDYSDLDSLPDVLKDVDCVVSCVAGDALQKQVDWAPALAKAGVKLFLPSEWGVGTDDDADVEGDYYKEAQDRVRHAYRKVGIPIVVVNVGWFVDIDFPPFLGLRMKQQSVNIVGDGNAMISWSWRSDIGECAAILLSDTRKWWHLLKDGKFECRMAGDEKCWNEIVDLIEKYSGTRLSRTYTPVAQVQAKLDALRKAGKSAWETIVFELQLSQAKGLDRIPKSKLDNALIFGDRRIGDVEDFVRERYGKKTKL